MIGFIIGLFVGELAPSSFRFRKRHKEQSRPERSWCTSPARTEATEKETCEKQKNHSRAALHADPLHNAHLFYTPSSTTQPQSSGSRHGSRNRPPSPLRRIVGIRRRAKE